MTRYGGFSHNIENYKRLRDELAQLEDHPDKSYPVLPLITHKERVDNLQRDIAKCGVVTDWMLKLEWPKHQTLPSPIKELTREEFLSMGELGFEAQIDTYHDSLHIPNEFEWFGGWSCRINIYYTYGTVSTHISCNCARPDDDRYIISLGHIVEPTSHNVNTYIMRYFRIGCDHRWVPVPEKSRMCLHASQCIKCGTEREIDSSD